MEATVQYVTNEQGEQVGVLLNMEAYRQFMAQKADDPDMLAGLSQEELQALAESQLASAAQSRLDELLSQQASDQLTAAESSELDALLAQIDQLTILKTRARYTLHKLENNNP